MNLELENKVVLITGGAKGIGEGITRAFAAEGAIACILGRNREEAERRLVAILSEAIAPPPRPRRATKPTRGSVNRRIAVKKRRSEVKRLRRTDDRE